MMVDKVRHCQSTTVASCLEFLTMVFKEGIESVAGDRHQRSSIHLA